MSDALDPIRRAVATAAPVAPGLSDEDRKALIARCAQEDEDDVGNGRRLLHGHENDVLYVERVGWYVFDGTRWAEDEAGAAMRRLCHGVAERIAEEAAVVYEARSERERRVIEAAERIIADVEAGKRTDEDRRAIKAAADVTKNLVSRRARRLRWKRTSSNSGKLDGMMREAAPYRTRPIGDLNPEPLAVNLMNGTLRFVSEVDEECPDPDVERLVWSAQLDPHRREDLISKRVEAAWREEAKAPTFEAFLARCLPDAAVRSFLQRYFGYALTGLTHEQKLCFFWGAGRNGKSTLVDIVARILGDYAVATDFATLGGDDKRKGGEATPEIARLPAARLVRASEPEQGVRLKEGLVKSLTAGEPISARRLHQDYFEFYPSFKLILSGNHKPAIVGTDDGIWRRVLFVPWLVQIDASEVDPRLPNRLWEERDGILTWMVEGALAWLRQGLDPPPAVTAATEEYRDESDPVGSFIRQACIVTGEPCDMERPRELYEAYARFCAAEGMFAFNQVTFTRRLSAAAKKIWRRPDGGVAQFERQHSGGSIYRGIRIAADFVPSHTPDDDRERMAE